MVTNQYKNPVKTDIRLVGGDMSYFSVNVDGVYMERQYLKDVEIPAQDSIFIFIKANINPSGINNPMLACDTLTFTTNGNKQNVELLAYGQDAHFILPNDTIRIPQEDGSVYEIPYRIVAEEGKEVTWKNDKPYVIYGHAVVDSDAKLIIEKGTRVHLHQGATLWIYVDGCLEVNGTKDEPVTFRGDRLEKGYENVHGQWNKIWICESDRDSKIDYAIIKNAFIGIHAETLEERKNNKLILTNSIIKTSQSGLLAQAYTIEASNNVFMDCKQFCAALTQGGDYTFVNNTLYNRYSNRRTDPALYLSNYYKYPNDDIGVSDFSGNFVNNIVSGSQDEEFRYSTPMKEAKFSASFENCLLKTDLKFLENSAITHTNTLLNINPEFEDEKEYKDLKLKSTSPCKNAGKSVPWLLTDIEGNLRNTSFPSIGAYE